MRSQLNIHEAKSQMSKLVEQTQLGREFVIAKAGKPVAVLSPVKPRKRRKLGVLDGKLKVPDDFNAPLPDEVLAAFEGRG